MKNIAVIGGNGQVGAELCLILSQHQDVRVIPICRNRFGSAFLRYHGLACRHGSVADASQTQGLIGDCDLVVNLAYSLGSGRPREQRQANKQLIDCAARFSKSRSRVIYFSTQSVYGDPSPDTNWRWKSLYAKEKLKCESDAVHAGNRFERETFVLRIGHVVGEHQGLSRNIQSEIVAGKVNVPITNRGSNTVYTGTIAEAILNIAEGKESVGIYDLMNVPQWEWRKVYEHEASRIGAECNFDSSMPPTGKSRSSLNPIRWATKMVGQRPTLKQYGLRLAARLPASYNTRLQAVHFTNNAKRDVALLNAKPPVNEKLLRVEEGTNFMTSLTNTETILKDPMFQIPEDAPATRWPGDCQPNAS